MWARQLQRIDRGITPHESNHGSLNARREREVVHDLKVEARRRKAGAAGDQHMRNSGALLVVEF